MGYWLNKAKNKDNGKLTKMTEDTVVTDVTLQQEHLQEKNNILFNFVSECCKDLDTTPQEVIDNLLSVDDEVDIIKGRLEKNYLNGCIKCWIESGKKYYAMKAN